MGRGKHIDGCRIHDMEFWVCFVTSLWFLVNTFVSWAVVHCTVDEYCSVGTKARKWEDATGVNTDGRTKYIPMFTLFPFFHSFLLLLPLVTAVLLFPCSQLKLSCNRL
ncbi:hypothetical protein B0T13DRAFT_2737 [Neurospora crassa]|nr:hypothetical protein B0T13DRAFT_2737 [Neurospora crassa]